MGFENCFRKSIWPGVERVFGKEERRRQGTVLAHRLQWVSSFCSVLRARDLFPQDYLNKAPPLKAKGGIAAIAEMCQSDHSK